MSDNCNCLCVINHPNMKGICTADAHTEITFDSPTTGRVDVAMCAPCATATLAAKDAQSGGEQGR